MMRSACAVAASLATAVAVLPVSVAQAAAPAAADHSQAQPVPAGNHTSRAGDAPQWVQYPYLSPNGKGKLTVVAKVYVDPKRTSAKNGFTQDRVRLRVAVAKKKYSKVSKPRSVGVLTDAALLARGHQTRKVTQRGVMTIKVPLSKQVSAKLANRGFTGQQAAVAVSLIHLKDTRKGPSRHDLTQVTAASLVKGKWSKRQVQRTTAAAIAMSTSASQADCGSGCFFLSNPDTPFYNNIYVQNNSPFQQQVTFQPSIQCMYAGTYSWPSGSKGYVPPPPATQATANAGDTVMFQYAIGGEFWLPSDAQAGLMGAEGSLKATGTQKTLTTDLVNSGNAAGQQAYGQLLEGSTYSQAGAVGAAATIGVRFLLSFIKGLSAGKCKDTSVYPQLFGVNTAVTGFGTNGVSDPTQAILPATNTWAGNPAAGNQGSVNAVPDSNFITGTLQQALGAQTNAVYYWNGGAPASMVSPNAGSGEYTGGSATYQDGLMQYIGPNPGSAGVVECYPNDAADPPGEDPCFISTLGEMYVQLSYLTNPVYNAGLLNEGKPPAMTATVDATGNYTLRCDLSQMTATLSTPFGNSAPTTIEQSTLATFQTNGSGQLPLNADWIVNFFGLTADGTPVYFNDSVTQTTNGIDTPYLSPNAANQPVSIQAASAGGSQAVALGTVSPDDLQNMVTLSGTPAVPTQFGCTAAPTISLPGLKIDAADGTAIAQAYGNNWPVPTVAGQGWPQGYYGNRKGPFDYKWQSVARQLNVTFQGPPLSAVANAPQG